MIDETRRSYTLEVDALALPVAQLLEGADFAAIERAALLLLSAEMSGGVVRRAACDHRLPHNAQAV